MKREALDAFATQTTRPTALEAAAADQHDMTQKTENYTTKGHNVSFVYSHASVPN